MTWIGKNLPGVLATLIAFFGALGTALATGGVSGVEWTVIAVATLTAAAAVGTTHQTAVRTAVRKSVARDRMLRERVDKPRKDGP